MAATRCPARNAAFYNILRTRTGSSQNTRVVSHDPGRRGRHGSKSNDNCKASKVTVQYQRTAEGEGETQLERFTLGIGLVKAYLTYHALNMRTIVAQRMHFHGRSVMPTLISLGGRAGCWQEGVMSSILVVRFLRDNPAMLITS